jgi:hypothetical protein
MAVNLPVMMQHSKQFLDQCLNQPIPVTDRRLSTQRLNAR